MATVVLAPFYVPRPPYYPQWQGVPSDNGPIWLTTTQVKFFGQPGQAPTKRWRYDYVPEREWLGKPERSRAIQLTTTQVKFFGQPGQAPTKPWHYDHVPQPNWVGQATAINPKLLALATPLSPFVPLQWAFNHQPPTAWTWEAPPALSLYLPPLAPFSNRWRYDYEPSKNWAWAVPPNITSSQVPFSKAWRYDYTPNTNWTWEAPVSLLGTLLAPSGTPVLPRMWRWDFEPDKLWSWASPQNNNVFSNQISSAFPPAALWSYEHVPAPNWIGTPQISWQILYNQAPPAPPIIPRMWRYDYTPEPVWGPKSSNTTTNVPVTNPFFKLWRYDYVPDPVWSWKVPQDFTLRIPQVAPFSRLWRYDYVPDTLWTGKPQAYAPRMGIFQRPFSKLWRYDHVPERYWVWKAPKSGPLNLPITVQMFGARGQAPTKQWHYDYYINSPLWLGKPARAYAAFNHAAAPPQPLPVEPDDNVRPFPRHKHYSNLRRQVLPIHRTFR